MSRVYSTECNHCPLTEPDSDGNQDLIFDRSCPVHGYDERAVVSPGDRLTGNPHDAAKDHKAEQAHDGSYYTIPEIVRSTRNFDRAHQHLQFGRHRSGLPATGDLPPARATTPGPRPEPPHGARAEGVTDEQQPRRSRAEAA